MKKSDLSVERCKTMSMLQKILGGKWKLEILYYIGELKSYLEANLREKENVPEVPETGMAVLRQQIVLAEAIENWITSLKEKFMQIQ